LQTDASAPSGARDACEGGGGVVVGGGVVGVGVGVVVVVDVVVVVVLVVVVWLCVVVVFVLVLLCLLQTVRPYTIVAMLTSSTQRKISVFSPNCATVRRVCKADLPNIV